MKRPTSFTSQQEMLRCPRRFFYRYLDNSLRTRSLRRLTSVRELGGHCVHDTLARMVHRVADGERISDQEKRIGDALKAFDQLVHSSINLPPGVLRSDTQLAESYNGVSCDEEIRDWRELIPIMMGNGFRFFDYFNFQSDKNGYELKAEQRIAYKHNGRSRRFVMDVLVRDNSGVSVIDWKTHSITNKDLQQVEIYQEYLLDSGMAKPTRIFGFAVDLLHEEVIERHFRRVRHTLGYAGAQPSKCLGKIPTATELSHTERYVAKPSFPACSICPFATICPSSAIHPEIYHEL